MDIYKQTIIAWGVSAFLVCAIQPVWAADPSVEPRVEASVLGPETVAAVQQALDDMEKAARLLSEEAMGTESPEKGVSFFVKKVHVQENLLFTEATLAPVVGPFEGRQQTMRSMQDLADKITAEYRKRGYLSSQAYIPPQEVKDGVFIINVVEGRIGQIIFEGNEHYSSALLGRYCDIHEGDFFTYQQLQKSIVKMNANPDRLVRAIVRRGSAPGTTDIVFKVEEKGLTHGSVFEDNQGSKPVGQNRLGVGLRRDNLLGQDDTLRVGGMGGKSFGSAFVEHSLPIAKINSVWKTGVSFAKSAPKKQYKPYGVSSTTMGYWGKLETRLLTDEAVALDWKTGLDLKESRTMFLSGTNSRERLRVLRFGPTMTVKDAWGGTVIENQFSLGMETMGAVLYNASSQRGGVTPDFFVSDLTVTRMQKMPLKTKLSLKGKAHVSPDKQPSSEQMALGGADTVRGYPEGDYFADEGVLVNAEYLVPFFFLPDTWNMPWSKSRMRDALDIAFFWDGGYGRFKDPASGQKASDSLSGAGVGLRARLTDAIYFTTDFAYAIGARPNSSDDTFRIHSGMQASW
ncbi:MAG: ShlB/FhaC/HecB family hemolysin secretion/activation protein [Candidatus Omnitrophica bacterium]|nr:ShlB/FhaC/HecB family hemolysin secretion/activation protein [Candidatus Omnitrophota bacterium]